MIIIKKRKIYKMAITRQTRQKELIKKEINKKTTFFNAENIFEQVIKKDKNISIATIYRNLKTLKENNQIYSYTCKGKNIYSKNSTSHCHFIDKKTNKTFHFQINNIDFINEIIKNIKKENKLKANQKIEIQSLQIEVKGNMINID